MNLGDMQKEIGLIVQDASLQPLLTGWINNAILEVANDYDLPPLALDDPAILNVDTTAWLQPLPSNFHKRLFMCKRLDTDTGRLRRVHIFSHIRHMAGKNHTFIGDHVKEVAVTIQGGSVQGDNYYLAIHPLAVDTMYLWYFQKPAVLVEPNDVSDCIPPGYERRVLFPKLIIQNYNYIIDQVRDFDIRPIQFWQTELIKGLFGARGQGIGLINFYNINYNPPRMVGNMNSIGYRPYYYGNF